VTTVRSVLSKKGAGVVTVKAASTVYDAAKLMYEQEIGSVVVVCEGRMVGIFTERDLVNRIAAVGVEPGTTRVGDVMTAPVTSCDSGMSLDECARMMMQNHLRHLPVVDGGELCGMITLRDILALRVEEQEKAIDFLQDHVYGARALA
jgi:CBS domain-containing protein